MIFLLSKVLYIGFICHTLYLSYLSLCLGSPADMICEGRMYVQEAEDTWPTKCNHILFEVEGIRMHMDIIV